MQDRPTALESHAPGGSLETCWERRRAELDLVAPNNRRQFHILVVGTGLAGASAAATLGEQGYRVTCLFLHDSPRRAHSIAAQGGINAAKNLCNDGDSVERLFLDTLKGGDYRAREANVYRLAQLSSGIIDHCVAQGVPFAREYGGSLANRSFGGAQVSRTFYARGQTGQQLLLGAYGSMQRQARAGRVALLPRREMLELVLVDGVARGVVARHLQTGAIERHAADAVLLCTGGYTNIYYLSTNARASNVTAAWRAHRRGAWFANPCFTQIHPTCIPVSGERQSKLTLMSESLRNDGRVWVPARSGDTRAAVDIPESERDYYLERRYPSYGNLTPRDVASRAAKERCDAGFGVGASGLAVYLDFADAIRREGADVIRARYGNLFEMYERITGEDPYATPMRIYPAPHYAMGGLWVDYDLQSTVPGLFVLGEANFSDHGANRLGASALMQGLADGYFIAPATVAGYLGGRALPRVDVDHPAFERAESEARQRLRRLLAVGGTRSAGSLHRELGRLLWDGCGMSRSEAGLRHTLEGVRELRERYWADVLVPGAGAGVNQALEYAGRVADYFECAELMVRDALERSESCGAHFREESQTRNGEALRDDERFAHVSVWEHVPGSDPRSHREALQFERATPSVRNYA